MEILVSVTAYNRNPYICFFVQWKSLYPLLRTTELLLKIHIPQIPGSPPATAKTANQNPFLRTKEIPLSVIAYSGNPYIRYYVQWKYLYALLRTMGIASKTSQDDRSRFSVQRKSVYAFLRTMEIRMSVIAYNGNPYIRYCVQLDS